MSIYIYIYRYLYIYIHMLKTAGKSSTITSMIRRSVRAFCMMFFRILLGPQEGMHKSSLNRVAQ